MIDVLRAEYFALCHTCRLRHPCLNHHGYLDFCERHRGHATSFVNREWLHEDRPWLRLAAWDPRKLLYSWTHRTQAPSWWAYAPNADVKQASQAAQTMTVTNLHSLASSVTAGWQSAGVDNTTDLYLDAHVQAVLDFANTAPGNSRGVYFFCAHALESTYTNPYTGTEGTLTLVDVTANAQAAIMLGFMPYTTQDEVAESAVMSVAATAGGVMPDKWALGVMNHSGAALAGSGNTVKYRGRYATVI